MSLTIKRRLTNSTLFYWNSPTIHAGFNLPFARHKTASRTVLKLAKHSREIRHEWDRRPFIIALFPQYRAGDISRRNKRNSSYEYLIQELRCYLTYVGINRNSTIAIRCSSRSVPYDAARVKFAKRNESNFSFTSLPTEINEIIFEELVLWNTRFSSESYYNASVAWFI